MIDSRSFRGILLDLEGVLYVGEKLVEGSIKTINYLKSQNIKIKYLTNTTTTSRNMIMEKLNKFNLITVESDIFSPVIAAKKLLIKKGISNIYLLANKSLEKDFEGFNFDEKNPEAVILGDIYKEFDWECLNKIFQLIINNETIIIGLHKNKYCRRGDSLTLDLGPFVQALEYASSKKAIIIGKPESNFFNLAIQDMELTNQQVVMIGDDIYADISGAKNNNIFAIQVKTGKYQKTDESNSYVQPDLRINSIADLPRILGSIK